MFDHEIQRIVDTAAVAIASRLLRPFRAIIRQEMFAASDAVDRLSAKMETELKEIREKLDG